MDENRYFQFLQGERRGEVLIFDRIEEEDGDVFIAFKDGSRCNEDLVLPIDERKPGSMLMAEVEDTKNVWKFETKHVGREEEKWEQDKDGNNHCVQPFVAGREVVTPIPPKKSKTKFGNVDHEVISAPSPNKKPPQDLSDPVWVMMDKAKKFDTQIPMELTISLPTKSLYNVAKESFDEGGIKVIEYIINNLDDNKLKDSLKIALFSAYEDTDVEPYTVKPKIESTPIGGAELFEPETVEKQIIGEPKVDSDYVISQDPIISKE